MSTFMMFSYGPTTKMMLILQRVGTLGSYPSQILKLMTVFKLLGCGFGRSKLQKNENFLFGWLLMMLPQPCTYSIIAK